MRFRAALGSTASWKRATQGRLVIALAGLAGVVAPPGAEAATWRVEKDGSGDFNTIHDALDVVSEGDTIRIGPGRYDETRQMTTPGGTFDVYAGITVNQLTFIGEGADQVILGPTAADFRPSGPIGFLSVMDVLTVQGLSVENTFCSIAHDGRLDVLDCEFRVFDNALDTSPTSAGTTFVRGCTFSGGIDRAIQISDLFGLGESSIVIETCTFVDNGIGLDVQLRGTTIQDCTFRENFLGAQLSFGAIGTIQRCTFTDNDRGIGISSGATAMLIDNTVTGGEANLLVFSSGFVTGSGNTFSGGTFSTIRFVARGNASLHGNHILRVDSPFVTVASTGDPHDIDLTENYWGTTDADEIAAWIEDANDDPFYVGTVLFEPFVPGPVSTESTSFSTLKARFGPHND